METPFSINDTCLESSSSSSLSLSLSLSSVLVDMSWAVTLKEWDPWTTAVPPMGESPDSGASSSSVLQFPSLTKT
eukprot:scaffold73912_cov40-Attheya_sp.AAC.1